MSNCKTCGCDFPQHLQMFEQIEALKKELSEAIDRERCEVVRRKFDVAENRQLTARLAAAEARLRKYEPEPGKCGHGVTEGDWCELCNKAYKEAAIEAESEDPI